MHEAMMPLCVCQGYVAMSPMCAASPCSTDSWEVNINVHNQNSPEAGQASDLCVLLTPERLRLVAYPSLCVPPPAWQGPARNAQPLPPLPVYVPPSNRDLRGLGTLSRTNPQHKSWAPMQLYMQSQVSQ